MKRSKCRCFLAEIRSTSVKFWCTTFDSSTRSCGILTLLLQFLGAENSKGVLNMTKQLLVIGLLLVFAAPVGAQELQLGSPGKPLAGTNNQVWESTCPEATRPISGSCSVIGASNSPETLHAFGPITTPNAWSCAWNSSVSASVQAWCAKIGNQ